ncbi:MAG: protein translocase subunit SecD, partial [Desulfovibrionaceae bacterium]
MDSLLRWRIVLVVIVVLLGAAWAVPSLPVVKHSGLAKWLLGDPVNLGLDLRGGIYLTLEVDAEKALEGKLESLAEQVKSYGEEEGFGFLNPKVVSENTVQLSLHDASKKADMDAFLQDSFNIFEATSTQEASGSYRYDLVLSEAYVEQYLRDTVRQTVDIVRNRIDRRGVVEPDIRQQEGGRIQIQLPGMENAHEAVNVITKMGHLEFKIETDVSPAEAASRPSEFDILTPKGESRQIVVRKAPALTGEYIADARVQFDQNQQPYVALSFDSTGARLFGEITAANIHRRMAIVLDGETHSAPVIQDAITGGRASITGRFTVQQANDLVNVLKDALPAPVEKVAESTIGPTLGQESINKGINAAAIGLALVVVFMVAYYGLSGIFADVVLCLNIVLILAGLSGFGATLTLPGIAGIILTMGMAVDANVIIFERIREELRRGLTAKAAVREGFGRATLTILDANVTTVIAAMILYQFGTGPIRGFAVTLTLGIITSMFTAIFVSRILFDIYAAKRDGQKSFSI